MFKAKCLCFLKVKVKVKSLSGVPLFVTPWTVAYQAPPSMGVSRQECWSGLPFPSPEDLPNPGIEPGSPALQAHALLSEPPGKPGLYTRGLKIGRTNVLCVVKVFLTEVLFRNSETISEFEQISEYIVSTDNECTVFLCWIRKLQIRK